jgi:hypothetical protein
LKRIFPALIFLCSAIYLTAQNHPERNLLTGKYTKVQVAEMIRSADDWHPFPTIDEPDEWDKFPGEIKKFFLQQGEGFLDYTWPVIPAAAALDFIRSGNRSNYSSVSFERRQALTSLVMAEIFERKGRFTDQIINGIWAICEETYWGISAHTGAQKAGAGLPDVQEPTVDLFAAETSAQLAWTLYLAGNILDEQSPLIRERIEYEIDRRVLTPNLTRDDFWWMGAAGSHLNNWTPWICSNWLPSVLLIEKDEEKKVEAIYKIMTIIDRFLNPYPADGGCDEGPGYWNEAGAALFNNLEMLYEYSDRKIDLYNEPLIHNIGTYIAKVYIRYPYSINFADASAIVHPDPAVVYLYGKRIENQTMMGYGTFLAKQRFKDKIKLDYRFGALGRRQLPMLFNRTEIMEYEAKEPLLYDFWLPDIQVMGARSYQNSNKSLYLAAKGGHNGESHNHNDVGNFIVYLNGYPAIIDIGVETYTRQTFGPERYTIWTMQSGYHNLPTINGVMQSPGRDFKAGNANFSATKKHVAFKLDLAGAYPGEAGITECIRSITLKRGKEIVLHDNHRFKKSDNQLDMNLMTHFLVETNDPGRLILINRNVAEDKLVLIYDKNIFDLKVQKIPVEDGRLKTVWGDELIRLVFSATSLPQNGDYSIKFIDKSLD